MLGHVSIGVQDLERAARFYDAALLELGYVRLWMGADGLGYGEPNGPEKLNIFRRDDAGAPGGGFHLAFTAPDRASVGAFHRATLASGAAITARRDFAQNTLRPTTQHSSLIPRGIG